MKLLALGINALLSINLSIGLVLPGYLGSEQNRQNTDPVVRIEGFGVEMSALPTLTVENVESIVEQVAATGAVYIRQNIDWSLVEPSPDVYDWSSVVPLDLLFAAARAQEIQIVAVLTGGPVYLAGGGEPISRSAVRERWTKFVQAAVGQFGEYVDIWEIGSAVNSRYALTPFLSPLSRDVAVGPNVKFYSKLLRDASDAIKEVDPNDQVWLGSLTGIFDASCAMNPLTFLLELNANKTWNDFDAILYSPAQGSAAPEYASSGVVNSECASNLMTIPTSLSEEVHAVQELARQLGGKPVMASDMGWGSGELSILSANRGISADEVEADLLVRASSILMAQNSIPVIFWQTDITTNQSTNYALSNLQELLNDTKPIGRIEGQDSLVHEYQFRKGGEYTIIAWRAWDGDIEYPANLHVGGIKSLTAWSADAEGLTRDNSWLIRSGGDDEIVVSLNERPVIYQGRSSDLVVNLQYLVKDQVELAQIEIKELIKRWLNDAKSEVVHMLEQEFDKAKDNALEWGEDQLDELLP